MKIIDQSLLDKVSAGAKESPRLRMNYNFLRPAEQASIARASSVVGV